MSLPPSALRRHQAKPSAAASPSLMLDSPVKRAVGEGRRRIPRSLRVFHVQGPGVRVRITAEHPDEQTTGWLLARTIELLAEKGLADGVVALRTDPSGPLGRRHWLDVYLQDMHRPLGPLNFEDHFQCVYSEAILPPEAGPSQSLEHAHVERLGSNGEKQDLERDQRVPVKCSAGSLSDTPLNWGPAARAGGSTVPPASARWGDSAARVGARGPSVLHHRTTSSRHLGRDARLSQSCGNAFFSQSCTSAEASNAFYRSDAGSWQDLSSDRGNYAVGSDARGSPSQSSSSHGAPPPSPVALSTLEVPLQRGVDSPRYPRSTSGGHRDSSASHEGSSGQHEGATCTYRHPSRPGGVCVWHFRDEGVIGSGGFSVVYKVRKKDTGRLYAMKVVAKDKVAHERHKIRRALSERDVLKQCDSPFIVKLYWAFQTRRHLFLVNELCPGGDLFRLLRDCRRFPEDVCRFVFAEVLLGLHHLHARNILYRDLKAENVLVDLDGHCRLADFGLSKTLSDGCRRTYSFCGSPEYLSPEMLLGTGHDKTLDYYGLGGLLYEMLTGIPPHYSVNRNSMYSKILQGNLSFPSTLKVSPESMDLVERLLHLEPARRLGAGPAGVDSIFAHPWLRDVDWKQVSERRGTSPLMPYLQRQRLGIGNSHEPLYSRVAAGVSGACFPEFSPSDFLWEAPTTCPFRHFDWENKWLLNEAPERCSLILPTGNTGGHQCYESHDDDRVASSLAAFGRLEAPVAPPFGRAPRAAQMPQETSQRLEKDCGDRTRVIATVHIQCAPDPILKRTRIVLNQTNCASVGAAETASQDLPVSLPCSAAPASLRHHRSNLSTPDQVSIGSSSSTQSYSCVAALTGTSGMKASGGWVTVHPEIRFPCAGSIHAHAVDDLAGKRDEPANGGGIAHHIGHNGVAHAAGTKALPRPSFAKTTAVRNAKSRDAPLQLPKPVAAVAQFSSRQRPPTGQDGTKVFMRGTVSNQLRARALQSVLELP
ncbi:putative serine/threonine protein kinase AktR [Besnoitia besnoiti]|uniref:Putative serine/threonine protein kinase AktR n=1 Tax=Besnoitia besnoiti TaxID=94643 RepID=A0A2A9MQG7_BESBE|nr:putative serine/threonine protein kinase AktR [Besnoitia besnoiti]PFH38467.1 putative serine/threonine protein kinase AktR [Besnoitia besnoiti]